MPLKLPSYLVQNTPDDHQLSFYLGRLCLHFCYLNKRSAPQYGLMLQYCQYYLQKSRNDPGYHTECAYWLGISEIMLESRATKIPRAIAHAKRAVEYLQTALSHPEYGANAFYLVGEYYLENNKLSHLPNKNNSTAAQYLGQALLKSDATLSQESKIKLIELLTQMSKNGIAAYYLGVYYQEQGEHNQARGHLNRAFAQLQNAAYIRNCTDSMRYMAYLYMREPFNKVDNGDSEHWLEKAKNTELQALVIKIIQAIKKDPDNLQHKYAAEIEEIMASSQDNAMASQCLGKYSLALGHEAEAKSYFKQALAQIERCGYSKASYIYRYFEQDGRDSLDDLDTHSHKNMIRNN